MKLPGFHQTSRWWISPNGQLVPAVFLLAPPKCSRDSIPQPRGSKSSSQFPAESMQVVPLRDCFFLLLLSTSSSSLWLKDTAGRFPAELTFPSVVDTSGSGVAAVVIAVVASPETAAVVVFFPPSDDEARPAASFPLKRGATACLPEFAAAATSDADRRRAYSNSCNRRANCSLSCSDRSRSCSRWIAMANARSGSIRAPSHEEDASMFTHFVIEVEVATSEEKQNQAIPNGP